MKRIIVWGTGKRARELVANLKCGKIIAFVETKPCKRTFDGITILKYEELRNIEFDLLIISMQHPLDAYLSAKRLRIDENKIICLYLQDLSGEDASAQYSVLKKYKVLFANKYYLNLTKDCSQILDEINMFRRNPRVYDINTKEKLGEEDSEQGGIC